MKGLFFLLAMIVSWCAFSNRIIGNDDISHAVQLVSRFTPQAKDHVRLIKDQTAGTNITISKDGEGVSIKAADRLHMVRGYGWYLKHIAKVHFSWNGDRLELPVPLPAPENPVTVKMASATNFAYNYCTLSYTMAFWDWKRWEREIDFLALNGFSHALVTAGLEKTWQTFLSHLGYPRQDISSFIPSMAYAAWWNMGNLEGFGGPLTQRLIDNEAELGRRIVTRMKELGMVPVLQGYVGFVPSDFSRKTRIEGLKTVPQGQWVGFNRPWVVDPTCEAFPRLASVWYKSLHEVYGSVTTGYGGDLFHEGGKKGDINVTGAAKAVQNAMHKASPGAIWFLQAWHGNPTKELIQGTDPDTTVILQLTRDMAHGGQRLRTFDGRPWLWCELANFGGNTGLYGGLPLLSRLGSDLKPYESTGLSGMGILSEGVETNPLHYELFFDRMWTKSDINLNQWIIDYASRRYGSAPQGLTLGLALLAHSIYNPAQQQEGCTESIICARPGWGVVKASTWASGNRYYQLEPIARAARLFTDEASKNTSLLGQETFLYDLTDINRQLLADAAFYQLKIVKRAYDSGKLDDYNREAAFFLNMIAEMDALLDTCQPFRLAVWLDRATAKGNTEREKKLMAVSARRLITTWIDKAPQDLNDYSNRQWAGLVRDYYLPRWKIFLDSHAQVLQGKKTSAEASRAALDQIIRHELAFAGLDQSYPSRPQGNTLFVAQRIQKMMRDKLPLLYDEERTGDGMPWDLKQGTPLTFNVTDAIAEEGSYMVTFQWKKGASALKIHSVKLLEGQTEVAADNHEGWTGVENKNNTYMLKLPKYRAGLDSYTLKAEVEGASGSDSRGVMTIRRIR